MFYNYVLQNKKNKTLYIGYTNDLIYDEACLSEKDAKHRESYLKTTQGRKLLKRRLKEYFYKK